MALYEDRQGDLWVGTFGGGLARIAGDSGAVIRYPFGGADASALSDPRASAIAEDARGNLWIGTAGGGLNLLDRKTGRFHRYRRNDRGSEQSQRRRDLCIARRPARRPVDRHGGRRPRSHGRQLGGAGRGALREPDGRRRHDAPGGVRHRVGHRWPPVAQHEQRPHALRSARAHDQVLPRGARPAGRRLQLQRSLSRPRRHAVLRRQQRLQRVRAEGGDEGSAAAARRADLGRQAQSTAPVAGPARKRAGRCSSRTATSC